MNKLKMIDLEILLPLIKASAGIMSIVSLCFILFGDWQISSISWNITTVLLWAYVTIKDKK